MGSLVSGMSPNMMAYSGNRSDGQDPLADYMTASNEPADEDGNLNNDIYCTLVMIRYTSTLAWENHQLFDIYF